MNRIARRTARRTAAAGGIGLLLAVAGFGLAPAALADDGPQQDLVALSAPAPAELGLAGQPVEYTDTVTNTGTTTTDPLVLRFLLDGGGGLPENAASLEYRADDGTWQPVPLDFHSPAFSGELPGSFTLAPGATRTVQLRIGLPMGTPHNGDSNGGTQSLKVHTTVSRTAAGAAAATDDHVIKVDALSSALSGVPASVTAGGPGAVLTTKVTDPTASGYENITHVLLTDTHATVEVQRAGRWTALTPKTDSAEPGTSIWELDGKDFTLPPHTAKVAQIRVSYDAAAGGHRAELTDCVLVNAGAKPLSGTTFCAQRTTLDVKAAPAKASSPTPTPTATASPAAASAPSAQLAETGSNDNTPMALGAGALVLAGALTVAAATHRRRTHH